MWAVYNFSDLKLDYKYFIQWVEINIDYENDPKEICIIGNFDNTVDTSLFIVVNEDTKQLYINTLFTDHTESIMLYCIKDHVYDHKTTLVYPMEKFYEEYGVECVPFFTTTNYPNYLDLKTSLCEQIHDNTWLEKISQCYMKENYIYEIKNDNISDILLVDENIYIDFKSEDDLLLFKLKFG